MKFSFPVLAMRVAALVSLSVPAVSQTQYPVGEMHVTPAMQNKIDLFPLTAVRLRRSPFKTAQDTDVSYLVGLDADRLLYWYRKIAGIDPGTTHYGGWENGGSNILGHYLSACSTMYAATGDKRLLEKVDYIVSALDQCMSRSAEHTLFNDPGEPRVFREMEHDTLHFTMAGPAFPFVNGSNPWYGLHKIYAGLRDAYFYCGNARAKTLLIRCADWALDFASHLSYERFQQMLDVEHGGIAEVIADVYAITGDEKYRRLAEAFVHQRIARPVAQGMDMLYPQHANAQIPKFVGYARLYELAGAADSMEGAAAFHFWNMVLDDHSFVNGNNGEFERFGPAGRISEQIGYSSEETCNAYNMGKLSDALYQLTGDRKYVDYYENLLYNDLLAAIGPDPGMFCYYLSLKPGFFKTYSTAYNSNWCCVGTGMENPASYGLMIYAHHESDLYVNLFIPSQLSWKEKKFRLRQEGRFPETDTVRFTVAEAGAKPVRLFIREPRWTKAATVLVNGKTFPVTRTPDDYIRVDRRWKAGDSITLVTPMELSMRPSADNPRLGAFFFGPLMLAGDFGRVKMEGISQRVRDQWENGDAAELPRQPVILADSRSPSAGITPVPGRSLTFRARTTDPARPVVFRPFYQIVRDRYSVYWDVFTPGQWKAYQTQRVQDIQDEVRMDDSLGEAAHHMQGKNMFTGRSFFRTFRSARDSGWVSYVMTADSGKPLLLDCTYWGGGWGPAPRGRLDVYVDGVRVGVQRFSQSVENHPIVFFHAVYHIPPELTRGKKTIRVRFQSGREKINTGVFDCKLLTAAGLTLPGLIKNR